MRVRLVAVGCGCATQALLRVHLTLLLAATSVSANCSSQQVPDKVVSAAKSGASAWGFVPQFGPQTDGAAAAANGRGRDHNAPPTANSSPLRRLQTAYLSLRNETCARVLASAPVLPRAQADAFLRAYQGYNGTGSEASVINAAANLLSRPEVAAFLSRPDSFALGGLDYDMVRCAVLDASVTQGLAEFAVRGRAEEVLVERLLDDGTLMRDMLVAGGASGGKFGDAMRILNNLLNASEVLSVVENRWATSRRPIEGASSRADHGVPRVQCTAIPLGYNNSCIHDPWGRMAGFPKRGVASAKECCSMCQQATGCISWNWYDNTCNCFHSVGAPSKVNLGSCIAGGALPLPPPPPSPPKPAPPKPPTHPWDDRSPDTVLRRLALGTALEHAVPIKHMNVDSFIDPTRRYLHYERAYQAGDLDPAFEVLSGFELRHVTNSPALDVELSWMRQTLANYRPDLIAVNTSANLWRYAMAVRTDVRYGHSQWLTNGTHNYSQIPAAGGECGPRAWFGRFARRSYGLPVWGMRQPGHACMATWSPLGWSVLLGAGWEHGWWGDDTGTRTQGGPDFNLETQSREYRGTFQKVLRGQWLAKARMEQPVDPSWSPRVPGKRYGVGGIWRVPTF